MNADEETLPCWADHSAPWHQLSLRKGCAGCEIEQLRATCNEAIEVLEKWTQADHGLGTLGTRMTINHIKRVLGNAHRYVSNYNGEMTMHKIFAFNNGGPHGWMHAVAIADDGHVIGQHICSSEGFMPHDLGINSDWKHDGYDKHFGAGNWQIEWVPTDQIKTHAELQAAFELNKALPPPPESEMPGAVVTTVDAEGNEHTHRIGP